MRKLLLIIILTTIKSFGQTLESDRLALVAIYNAATSCIYSQGISGWNVPGAPGDSPCGWTGITCEGGRVTRLDMSNSPIDGVLAPEIGNLDALKYLNLPGHGSEFMGCQGEIPVTLGNLTNLEYLNIQGNEFAWTNVSVIGNLAKLKELRMDTSGDYPAEFANLVNLETCVIGQYGPWYGLNIKFPDVIYQWTKIKHLYMAGLVYTTPMTGQIGNLSNLETLELGSLTGNNIPPEMGSLTKLTRLVIRGDNYVGRDIDAIPSELGNLVNLRYLELTGDNISGSIPASFANLTELRELYLYNNKLSGSIPSFWGSLVNLQRLDLGSNQFSGAVPVELTTMPGLTFLSVYDNQLSGPLPDLSASLSNFRVNVTRNKFTFAGLEQNLAKLNGYYWQAKIPMVVNGTQATTSTGVPATLSVNAGGTLANNTYRWYRNNVFLVAKVGDPNFETPDEGYYHVTVTNTQLPLLTLESVKYTIVRLPVTLVSFEGQSENNQTKLTWKTTSETNNKGFKIERSADARMFEKIGFVDGSGDTKENQFYHFTDLHPIAKGYYRLKQLDYDGKFEYSKIVMVKRSNGVFKIYPNPAQDNLIISGIEGEQDLNIVNDAGRMIMSTKVSAGKPVSIRSLKPGLYTVKVGTEAGRILVAK